MNRTVSRNRSGIKTFRALIKSITAIIGLSLLVYLMLFFAWETTKLPAWRVSGSLESSVRMTQDSAVVFQQVSAADFAGYAHPSIGDTLLTLGQNPKSIRDILRVFNTPFPPGTTLPVTYRHEGTVQSTTMIMRVPSTAEFLLITALLVLRVLVALTFTGTALWAFFARPDSAAVRALALFSFAIAAFMVAGVQAISSDFAAFAIPYEMQIRNVLRALFLFFGAFWLNLTLLFPRPVRLMRDHPTAAYLLCYALPGLLYAIDVLRWWQGWKAAGAPIQILILIVITAQVAAGMTLLAVRRARTTDRIERRQTRLVLWGTGVGLSLLFLIILVATFVPWILADNKRALVVINLSFLGLLLAPLSFAYAFGRYRLLDVEARLRRGTRYALSTGVLLAILASAVYGGGTLLQRKLLASGPMLFLTMMATAAVVVPGARGIQKVMERRFYPERQRLRDMFRDFLQRTFTIGDGVTFWDQLERHLREGLNVEGVYPLLRKTGNGAFLFRNQESTPFHVDSGLPERLRRERRPVMVDEISANARIQLTPEERDWLSERKIAVVLPLITHSDLIGFVGLGMKSDNDDFAAEELRLLDSLAPQVALASENIRLLEENVEKKRLEEQLQMARQIQNGFLLRDIPDTPGLDVAARCRFCYEVAGDYYDIIPLANGETLLAIGDVSGKGAGAALLMANLQASLRTAAGVGVRLSDIVSRINDLICRNTSPEQFITFFAAVFDPMRSELTYVNAGHNPPLLLRADGRVETLDVGGLILGMTPGIRYSEAIVPLGAEDLMLLYTDGASEAMNTAEEEFGEQRMLHVVRTHGSAAPSAILDHIESEVFSFHGSDVLEDDFTLLLARVG